MLGLRMILWGPLTVFLCLILVGNGNCASTCAMFSTLMHERHNTKTVVFGGKVCGCVFFLMIFNFIHVFSLVSG